MRAREAFTGAACPTDGGTHDLPRELGDAPSLRDRGQRQARGDLSIPKRILYIDSEGWFVTASDQYDRDGKLWKTLALFNTYRDRPVPDARVAIYPYKRMFQLGLVDEDLQTGTSSVVYMPGDVARPRMLVHRHGNRGQRVLRSYRYTVLFEPAEEGGYVATIPVLRIATQGETLREARAMARDAIRCFIESLAKDGEEIPIEQPAAITERVAVRLLARA